MQIDTRFPRGNKLIEITISDGGTKVVEMMDAKEARVFKDNLESVIFDINRILDDEESDA